MPPGRSHLPDRETGGQQAPIARVRGIGLGDPLAHGGRPDDATNSGRILSPHIVPKSLALAMRMRRTDLGDEHPDIRAVPGASPAMALAPLTQDHENHHAR